MSESSQKWAFAKEFAVDFTSSHADLQARIKNGDSPPTIAADLAKLAKSLSDATGSLPNHDQASYEQQIKALEKSLHDIQQPSKTRFAFKRKAAAKPASPKIEENKPAETVDNVWTFSKRSEEYLAPDSIPTSDLTIAELDWCIVNLTSLANISVLHVQNLSNTVLLLPPIAGSALVHDLKNCIIVLGAHQFRMHTSEYVDVYISIASSPIIEHCRHIRFASYPFAKSNSEGYKTVQDFSHIKASPSPNWSLLTEKVEEWPLKPVAVRETLERLCPHK